MIPDEAIQRLTVLGYTTKDDSAIWRGLFEQNDASLAWSLLELLEARHAQHAYWGPQFMEYAADCRRRFPVPDLTTYSAAERVQNDILREKMQQSFESNDRRKPRNGTGLINVFWTERIGLPALAEVFAPQSIVLTDDELRTWRSEVYTTSGPGCDWYATEGWRISKAFEVSSDEIMYWKVDHYYTGGSQSELWRSRRDQIEYVEPIDVTTA